MPAHAAIRPVSFTHSTRIRAQRTRGFTLVEVILASFVLIFGITSALIALKGGYNAIDTARDTTLAAQVMQSEMERIRLLPWDTTSLDASGKLKPAIIRLPEKEALNIADIFPAGTTTDKLVKKFTAVRTVSEVPDRSSEMKSITIIVTWTGMNGTRHTRTSTTQYAKSGLYDYYYTKAL